MDRPGIVDGAAAIAQKEWTRKAGTLVFAVIHGFDRRRVAAARSRICPAWALDRLARIASAIVSASGGVTPII